MTSGRGADMQKIKQPNRNKVTALLFIVLFASIGTYFVLRSYAASGWGVSFDHSLIREDYPANHNFNIPVYLTVPDNGQYHVNVHIATDSGYGLRNPKYSCGEFSCNTSTYCGWGTGGGSCYDSPTGFCAAFSNAAGTHLLLTANLFAYPHSPEDDEWYGFYVDVRHHDGPCEAGDYFSTDFAGGDIGTLADSQRSFVQGTGGDDPGNDDSSDDGRAGDGEGDRGKGKGTQGLGTGSGGGGGDSTAKQQANRPNPLPKSSSQGNAKQPEFNPSPFYDGKQYAPGSEPDNQSIGSFLANGGKTVAKGLPFALGAITIAGTGFAVYWRLWRKH